MQYHQYQWVHAGCHINPQKQRSAMRAAAWPVTYAVALADAGGQPAPAPLAT